MTFTITVPLWMMLPLALTLLLFAGGIWTDWLDSGGFEFDCTSIAAVLCVIGWLGVLYGRYEHWFVLPVLITAVAAYLVWDESPKREVRRTLGTLLASGWLLVIYGRLTA